MEVADVSAREKIEIFISCRSLRNMDTFSLSDPQVIIYMKNNQNMPWAETGRTEIIKDNLNPNFTKTLIIDYIFEIQQHLRFEVIDIDGPTSFEYIGEAFTTVGKIVGAKNQLAVLDIVDKQQKRGGKIILRAEKVGNTKQNLYLKLRCRNIPDIHTFSKTTPFYRLHRCREDNFWLSVYESPNFRGNLNPIFPTVNLSMQKLCNGDTYRPIKLEVWDYQTSGQHNYIAECNFSVNDVANGGVREIKLKNLKKNKECGSVVFDQVAIEEKPDFFDYLSGGCQLNLITAIDFTGSNGVPSRPESLHYINPRGELNQYQKAILSVGEILINYDYDKKIPVYGFGGKPRLPHFSSSNVLHCFPLNGNPSDPEVFALDGIMGIYMSVLPCVELSGPTLFNPIITESMKIAQIHKNQGSNNYNILLILTDGEIHDMDATKTSIVNSAYLPLSIIIIGIGNADFGNMEILDGDDGLIDSYGNKCVRDLVQFVPFNKYNGNPSILAQKVLEELPNQLCEYMRLIGKKPNPPQDIDMNTYGLNRSFTGASETNSMAFTSQKNIASPYQSFAGGVQGGPGNVGSFNAGIPAQTQQAGFMSMVQPSPSVGGIGNPYASVGINNVQAGAQGMPQQGNSQFYNQNPMGFGGPPANPFGQTTMMFGQNLLGSLGVQNQGQNSGNQPQVGFSIGPAYGPGPVQGNFDPNNPYQYPPPGK